MAVRYFIHYGVLENYSRGKVRAFNKRSLIAAFDAMRETLRIQQ